MRPEIVVTCIRKCAIGCIILAIGGVVIYAVLSFRASQAKGAFDAYHDNVMKPDLEKFLTAAKATPNRLALGTIPIPDLALRYEDARLSMDWDRERYHRNLAKEFTFYIGILAILLYGYQLAAHKALRAKASHVNTA